MEALLQTCAAAGASPHVVALLEMPYPLTGRIGADYWCGPELCNVVADGTRGRGVTVLLRDGVQCLGTVVESHWVAVAIRDRLLGEFVVVAAYLPLASKGAGRVTYGEYWAGMLESARRL